MRWILLSLVLMGCKSVKHSENRKNETVIQRPVASESVIVRAQPDPFEWKWNGIFSIDHSKPIVRIILHMSIKKHGDFRQDQVVLGPTITQTEQGVQTRFLFPWWLLRRYSWSDGYIVLSKNGSAPLIVSVHRKGEMKANFAKPESNPSFTSLEVYYGKQYWMALSNK